MGLCLDCQTLTTPKTMAPALIGKNRAREIIINVLLPFFYARAHLLGDPGLGRRCLELYRSFPPGQENEVTREMKGYWASPGKTSRDKLRRQTAGADSPVRVAERQDERETS